MAELKPRTLISARWWKTLVPGQSIAFGHDPCNDNTHDLAEFLLGGMGGEGGAFPFLKEVFAPPNT